ncbi:MAG: ABC transporter permease [Kineosporiaceae bacterium]|jgi:peptide/nickel transport system permease protein
MTINPERPALPDDVVPDDPSADAAVPPPLDPDAPVLAGAGGGAAAAAAAAADLAATQAAARAARKTARRESWRLLRRRPAFISGVFIVLVWVICAIGGRSIAPHDPIIGDPFFTHVGPGSKNGEYLLGTDRLGRDVLSRVIVGARDVLIVAPLAAVLGIILGTMIGLIMGYYRGLVDDILSRIVEAFISLPVALVGLLALVVFPPSRLTLILVVGGLFAPIVARTVRAAVLSERELDYVQAARLQGESSLYIMVREILPNVTGPIIVEFTVRIGFAIFTVATLSFLGVGIQPPTPDWGLMITEEYSQIIDGFWWPVMFPSLAIASMVVAVNLIADALQGVLER